jgi:hypothetical protein
MLPGEGMRGAARWRSLIASGGAVLAVACVDPGGEFDAFVSRLPSRPEPGDAGEIPVCSVSPGSVSGPYLLALSVTLAPKKPIVVHVDLDSPEVDGAAALTLHAQPLSAADWATPVGDALDFGPFPVGPTGTWRGDLPGLEISGEANSVTGGDIAADVVLIGSLCGDGASYCGTVEGKVTEPLPLDLAGSTFTLTRVDDTGATPQTLAVDCAGNLADRP